jgi:hypothetical protein
MLFCVGVVMGGTLIGVGSKIFNKWILSFIINVLNRILKSLINLRKKLQWNNGSI